jgi:hypothetical protein
MRCLLGLQWVGCSRLRIAISFKIATGGGGGATGQTQLPEMRMLSGIGTRGMACP